MNGSLESIAGLMGHFAPILKIGKACPARSIRLLIAACALLSGKQKSG
jgi:hypothetical protein